MRPAARVQAAIEILDEIIGGVAAEKALTGWARRSRFAGSKDRAAVRDHVYDVLRRRRSVLAEGQAEAGRALMIGVLTQDGADLGVLFSGDGYGPDPIGPEDQTGAGTPRRVDLPEWVVDPLKASLGADFDANAEALRHRAPVTLRVNLRKATREGAIEALSRDGIVAVPNAVASTALDVVEGARKVAQSAAYLNGLVELQDASCQAAIAALSVSDGARVLDYCAGGGGKTLAMAGRTQAVFFAHDANPERMQDLPNRAARAGVDVRLLTHDEVLDEAPFDVVFCDVPCSGTGSWRRSPDAKWRFMPEDLAALTKVQSAILEDAANLVAQGGQLIYATCSMLRAENHDRIDAFVTDGWDVEEQIQWTLADGCDGFFLAILRKMQP